MRIVARKPLREFWEKYPDSEQALKSWWREAKFATWATPAKVKAKYGSASIIGDNRVVFNICGNKYRLVMKFNYEVGVGLVRFIGTHAEYDKIDAEKV
ncbi:MAG: type II toxin-antitoxin system HigB family toxin [Kiloniellales bacterium]|nr:type II toxin-antitoxin system HigB family toxin [Kiloniellales bacterium]